uniref:Uncharacterized protein n=1 Tax=Magallana gigas TaxID=29159 RepID=K1PV27_MAGGI
MSLEQTSETFRNAGYYPCEIGGLPCEKEETTKRHSSTWSHLWGDFVSSTTLHGIRFIFYQDTYIIRRQPACCFGHC